MTLGKLDTDAIKKLADLLKETDLSEIEYEVNGTKIRVARNLISAATISAPAQASAPSLSSHSAPASPDKHPGAVLSPMVGTVYLAPEPGALPFVKTGDSVSIGQTLLIIEAMKVMNPIKAAKAGVVKQILVKDGEPVEFSTALLVIE